MDKLVFGCGYLGRRVAAAWRDAGHRVFVVTRRQERARELAAEGFVPHVADIATGHPVAGLPPAQTVLFAVGYDRASAPSMREVYVGGLRCVLDSLTAPPERLLYVSSTGVFGQRDGQWVDESSPCEPVREGGRICLEAEQLLAAHQSGAGRIILRMAGLYGPGRLPRREKIARGEPIAARPDHALNLIHVDDAARVVLAAEARATPPALYLVSDGHPAPRRAYYEELARLLGAPAPQFIEPSRDAPPRKRQPSDKRVGNRRVIDELGVTLAYPSFREGLAAALARAPGDGERLAVGGRSRDEGGGGPRTVDRGAKYP